MVSKDRRPDCASTAAADEGGGSGGAEGDREEADHGEEGEERIFECDKWGPEKDWGFS